MIKNTTTKSGPRLSSTRKKTRKEGDVDRMLLEEEDRMKQGYLAN